MSDFDPIGTVAFFRERHRVESATTGRVLRALPTGKLSYQPHVNSSTAGDTAWTIVRCLRLCNELTQTKRAEVVHDAHPVYEELIAAFHDNSSLLSEAVLPMTQATWLEEREVTSHGTLILRQSLGQIFWLFLFDAIHHRGQLSTYLRPLGAKVPSLYGPSRDAAA